MKKTNRSKPPNRRRKGRAGADSSARSAHPTRRDVMGSLRNWALGITVLGGAGLFAAHSVGKTIREHDLSVVGNGTPTIVQIHDPQCTLCRALQREARGALEDIGDDRLDYAIANIRSAEGQQFAARYRAEHVTLLLFDAKGVLRSSLQGPRSRRELSMAFRQLLPG